jgi:flagellar basal body-associated protein FliL
MSEEKESMSSTLKNTIIGVVVTMITAIGGVITTQFEKLFGGDEPAAEAAAPAQQAPAPIILNIENNQTQNNNAGGGTKVVEKVVEKPAPEKPKAKEDVEW